MEDESRGVSSTQKTSEVLQDIMNSLYSNLHFTMETGEDFENGRLPTLDTQLWIEDGRIMYKYYEKPMAAKTVIHKQSALAENSKMASLSQEMVRRMKTTSERIPMKERVQVVDDFSIKLITSGYGREQAGRIITAGLMGYENALRRDRDGKGKLHKSAADGAAARNRRKLLAKSNWFKKKPGKDGESAPIGKKTNLSGTRKPPGPKAVKNTNKTPVTSVLFVEQTSGGELAKRLRLAENKLAEITGWKVKVVEKSGTSIKQMLHKSNPWASVRCEREDCFPCKTGDDKADCHKRNILYESFCVICNEKGIEKVYVGESSRSSYERGGEHENDYLKSAADSHMFKHAMVDHDGEEKPRFSFRVKKYFQNPLARQISEAVSIRRKGEVVLNSKGVYNRCTIPRLVVHQDNTKPTPPESVGQDKKEPVEWHGRVPGAGKRRHQGGTGNHNEYRMENKRRRMFAENSDDGYTWGEKLPDSVRDRAAFLTKKSPSTNPVTVKHYKQTYLKVQN